MTYVFYISSLISGGGRREEVNFPVIAPATDEVLEELAKINKCKNLIIIKLFINVILYPKIMTYVFNEPSSCWKICLIPSHY